MPRFLTRPDGSRLAYHYTPAQSGGPVVVFCGGFRSDMTGAKATWLEAACTRDGFGYLRFDYFAHGQSDGDFRDGTLSRWVDDTKAVLQLAAGHEIVLVGSSMGGWIALRCLADGFKPLALIGIAAAPDFTRDLMRPALTAAMQDDLARQGYTLEHSEYDPENPTMITAALLADGEANCLLDREWGDVATPITLLQGRRDPDVPWHWPHRIAGAFPASPMTIHYIPDGDHRLSREQDLALLEKEVISACRRSSWSSAQTRG